MSPAAPGAGFDRYFHERATRFSALYRSEPVSRALGKGALFDRLRTTVEWVADVGASRVLDVGCGSGPLFAPLADRGVSVTGIDPAPAMVALAMTAASPYPDLVTVRREGFEQLEEEDAYDVAVALGVFDYVDEPTEVLLRLARAAPYVIASAPVPGLRLRARRVRYGAKGVAVHGYTRQELERLASASKLSVFRIVPLGRVGHLVMFSRLSI